MKIKACVGIGNYNLMIYHYSGKLYHFSIISYENKIHSFEGIYSSLDNAIKTGKSVVESLTYS